MADREAEIEQWVVWNGSLGVLDMVRIGRVEQGEPGRSAFLAPPYEVVGPFSLDALEAQGCIAFGACLVMSRAKWQEEQHDLRVEARKKRRAFRVRPDLDDDRDARKTLNLPADGPLEPSEINAAFRKLAKRAHPDAGGVDKDYHRISEARDALLAQFSSV
jgi:hypothetical protein